MSSRCWRSISVPLAWPSLTLDNAAIAMRENGWKRWKNVALWFPCILSRMRARLSLEQKPFMEMQCPLARENICQIYKPTSDVYTYESQFNSELSNLFVYMTNKENFQASLSVLFCLFSNSFIFSSCLLLVFLLEVNQNAPSWFHSLLSNWGKVPTFSSFSGGSKGGKHTSRVVIYHHVAKYDCLHVAHFLGKNCLWKRPYK